MKRKAFRCIWLCCLSLNWWHAVPTDIFRVAIVSEFTGADYGNSKRFIEGFLNFSAPYINSIGGIPMNGKNYMIQVISYDTQSDNARVALCVQAINMSQDMDGNNVGEIHAIVAATSKKNKAMFGPAQAAQIVNIHTSGGNPTMWLSTNTFAFGLHLPFVWYTRDPMKLAAQKGATTIAIIRSAAHGFSKASCIAALQWAQDAGLTVIGPSVAWCNNRSVQSGGCNVVSVSGGQRCVCGLQSEVDAFGYGYSIDSVPNFYQIDERAIGNGLAWRTVDNATVDFSRSMYQDMLSQGQFPDVVLNFAVEWHNIVQGMIEEGVSPKVLFGWQDGVSVDWAKAQDTQGNQRLTEIEGYWAMGFGQWHSAMNFQDPVFGTNANAVQQFQAQRGRYLDYDTAGAVAAGVALYKAMSTHFTGTFDSLSLAAKRDAVRVAMQDLNDETMWGTIRFNSKHQNIGRGTAAWQVVPNANLTPQQLCVLPTAASQADLFMPFPTWQSRTGCQMGRYNSGVACELCPVGRVQNESTAGLLANTCKKCTAGTGTNITGQIACPDCLPGSKQNGGQDEGVCQPCFIGYFQSNFGSTACVPCGLGKYAPHVGKANCSECASGTYQDSPGASNCRSCSAGFSSGTSGQSVCQLCIRGKYANQTTTTQCTWCPFGLDTNQVGSTSVHACVCPRLSFMRCANGNDLTQCNLNVTLTQSCSACSEGLECPGGSSLDAGIEFHKQPTVQKAYYVKKSNPYTVYKCLREDDCPGGPVGTCADTLYDIACSKCPDSYIKREDTCVECVGAAVVAPIAALIALLLCLVALYYLSNSFLIVNASVGLGATLTCSFMVVVVQMLGTLRQLNVPWPGGADRTMSICQVFIFDPNSVMLECLIGGDPLVRYLFRVMAPFAAGFVLLLLFLATQGLGEHRRWLGNKTMNCCFQGLNAIFISCACTVSVAYQCYAHPDGTTSLVEFPTVFCGESDQYPYIGLAAWLLLSTLLPFVAVSAWACYVAPMGRVDLARFRYLFYPYRPDVWWWGLVVLARSVLLGFSPMFMPDDPNAQVILVVFVLVIYLGFMSFYCPWKEIELCILEYVYLSSLLVIVVTVSTFMPRSEMHAGHEVFMMSVMTCLGLLFVTTGGYAAYGVLAHGMNAQYGRHYPLEMSNSEFAVAWQYLCQEASGMDPKSCELLLDHMNNYDRRATMDAMHAFSEATKGQIKIPHLSETRRLRGLAHSKYIERDDSGKKSFRAPSIIISFDHKDELSKTITRLQEEVKSAQSNSSLNNGTINEHKVNAEMLESMIETLNYTPGIDILHTPGRTPLATPRSATAGFCTPRDTAPLGTSPRGGTTPRGAHPETPRGTTPRDTNR